MLQFIDKESEDALCVLLNEEQEQYQEFLIMEEVNSWLLNEYDEYDDFWYEEY